MALGQFGVSGEHFLRHPSRHLHQIGIHFQIGVAQQRHAALAAADKLAGAAQLQVTAGDLEAVGVFVDDLQPLTRRLAERAGVEQDATGLVRPASDPVFSGSTFGSFAGSPSGVSVTTSRSSFTFPVGRAISFSPG